jgi:hypothetical protein
LANFLVSQVSGRKSVGEGIVSPVTGTHARRLRIFLSDSASFVYGQFCKQLLPTIHAVLIAKINLLSRKNGRLYAWLGRAAVAVGVAMSQSRRLSCLQTHAWEAWMLRSARPCFQFFGQKSGRWNQRQFLPRSRIIVAISPPIAESPLQSRTAATYAI